MFDTRNFVMAILHWKRGLLCDKKNTLENGCKIQTMSIEHWKPGGIFCGFDLDKPL